MIVAFNVNSSESIEAMRSKVKRWKGNNRMYKAITERLYIIGCSR